MRYIAKARCAIKHGPRSDLELPVYVHWFSDISSIKSALYGFNAEYLVLFFTSLTRNIKSTSSQRCKKYQVIRFCW